MSTITDITVSKIFVLNEAPKTRVLDRFWYDTTNKILKKCVSADSSKTDAECWEPIGIDPSAIKVTVENGQGNSTTLDLQTYVSAVAEGLIEISGQVTNLNNTKADKTALDTKQDKLNYYNEGDNVANITSETTNTNNVVAKNITLGGYEREVNGEAQCQHGVTISEDGVLSVSKQNNQYTNNLTTTIDGNTITLHSYYGESSIDSTSVITGEGIACTNNNPNDTTIMAAMSPVSTYVIGYGMSDDGDLALGYSGIGEGVLRALDVDNGKDPSTYSNGIRYEAVEIGDGEMSQESVKTMFFAGNKMVTENERSILTPVIEGELVDKELSEESLETHIPTSSAVVSYVDNQTTPIKEDIVDLQQTKSNHGVFYFEGGALTTTNKMPLNTPFSCVWTMAMTQEEFKKHKTYFPKIIGNLGYWSDAGYGWCINRIDSTSLIGIGANNGSGSGKYNTLDIINYLDGNPHIWLVVYNGTNISLYIDNVKRTSVAFTFESSEATYLLGIGSTPTSTSQNYGVWGKIYRIKYFNFDMSTDDAPYTIADYISGKDESPLLQTTQPVIDWHNLNGNTQSTTPTEGQSGTLELNRIDASYPRIFENGTFKVGYTYYIRLSGKVLFPSGQTGVSLRLHLPTSTAEITNNLTGEAVVSTPSNYQYIFGLGNGKLFDQTIKFTPTSTNTDSNSLFYFNQIATDSNSYVNVSVRCDSALLSLDDYSIEDKVLDISGNNNHATITGSVYGSKSGSVEKFVETVIGDVHEIVDDLRDEVNLLSQQITISTHTSTFTSSSTDITNIYTDESKAALPGRILIQPKLSNVAPMYFGENVSDKTKAFPLYPDQITDFYFEDINNFKVASDAVGDGCNFVIEWGVTNVVADIASAFTMYDDNGNKFKIKIANGGLVAEQLN